MTGICERLVMVQKELTIFPPSLSPFTVPCGSAYTWEVEAKTTRSSTVDREDKVWLLLNGGVGPAE